MLSPNIIEFVLDRLANKLIKMADINNVYALGVSAAQA